MKSVVFLKLQKKGFRPFSKKTGGIPFLNNFKKYIDKYFKNNYYNIYNNY